MDADALFPEGYHPVHTRWLPDHSRPAPRLSRSAAPVRYYFVDYGISSLFDPTVEQGRTVVGTYGLDQDVPELSDSKPYDPFKVDIFLIGNLAKTEVYQVESLIHDTCSAAS